MTGDLATDFVMAHYGGAPPIDVFPAEGGGLVGTGEVMHVAPDDFNGIARMGVADVGAYAFAAGGNPGWTIAEGFRGYRVTLELEQVQDADPFALSVPIAVPLEGRQEASVTRAEMTDTPPLATMNVGEPSPRRITKSSSSALANSTRPRMTTSNQVTPSSGVRKRTATPSPSDTFRSRQ